MGSQRVDGSLVLPEENLGDTAVGLDMEQDGRARAHGEVRDHKRTSRQGRFRRVEVTFLNTEKNNDSRKDLIVTI